MTRGEAIARALHWAAFGVRPTSTQPYQSGWIARADRFATSPIAEIRDDEVAISTAQEYVDERARCEKTKLESMVYRALKTWAIRNDAIEYFPAMRQMYRDELARLTQKAP